MSAVTSFRAAYIAICQASQYRRALKSVMATPYICVAARSKGQDIYTGSSCGEAWRCFFKDRFTPCMLQNSWKCASNKYFPVSRRRTQQSGATCSHCDGISDEASNKDKSKVLTRATARSRLTCIARSTLPRALHRHMVYRQPF